MPNSRRARTPRRQPPIRLLPVSVKRAADLVGGGRLRHRDTAIIGRGVSQRGVERGEVAGGGAGEREAPLPRIGRTLKHRVPATGAGGGLDLGAVVGPGRNWSQPKCRTTAGRHLGRQSPCGSRSRTGRDRAPGGCCWWAPCPSTGLASPPAGSRPAQKKRPRARPQKTGTSGESLRVIRGRRSSHHPIETSPSATG